MNGSRFKKKEEPKRSAPKVVRKIYDAKFGDELLGRLINKIMVSGKKSSAERIVYGALDAVQAKTGQPGIDAFRQALENIKPLVEVKSRRVGGSTYQVPIEVNPNRRVSLGLRWLVGYSRARSERTMADKLANEIMEAIQNRGGAVKKKDDTHAMAEANKAFAHFRW